MSRLHECDQKPGALLNMGPLPQFLLEAAPPLVEVGHTLAALKAIAWLQDGSKPTAIVIKDVVLPCLREMIKQDMGNWGALRTYCLFETKETDESLCTGLERGGLGSAKGGPRVKRNDIDRSFHKLSSSSGVEIKQPIATSTVQVNADGGKKRHYNAVEEAIVAIARKRHKGSGQDTSEELKHEESESEVETPDPDYEDDGFVVDDGEELEFESGAESVDED